MDISKIDENYETEIIIGAEDRVFASLDGKWFWQARGTRNCIGPFRTQLDAIDNYLAS